MTTEIIDRLAVALIRGMNAAVISAHDTDADLLRRFGGAARPLAEGLYEAAQHAVTEALTAADRKPGT